MNLDDILIEYVGEFGRYQWQIFILLCIASMMCPMHLMAQVFLAGAPDSHVCSYWEKPGNFCYTWMPELDDDLCVDLVENLTTSNPKLVQCKSLDMGSDNLINSSDYYTMFEGNLADCSSGWVYDTSTYGETVITEFDIVCDKQALPELALSLFFGGSLVGCIAYGMLADWIGRFLALYVATVHIILTGIVVAIAPGFWSFTLVRIILAPASYALYIIPLVWGTEIVAVSKRILAGLIIDYFFAFGYMLLAFFAIFINDWRVLQLALTLPGLLIFLAIPFLSESPRWLLSKGDIKKACKILRKTAKVNKTTVPDNLEEKFEMMKLEEAEAAATTKGTARIRDIGTSPSLLVWTISMSFIWYAHGLMYMGLSISTNKLGVDVYMAFIVSGAVEIPAYTAAIISQIYFGRRWSVCVLMLLAGVACLATSVIPEGPILLTVAMLGKFLISTSYGIIYVWAAEIYPTPIRGFGLGICGVIARLGDITSPYLLRLSLIWEPLPLVVFGSSTLLTGFLALVLPETKGKALPDTIEEAEMLKRSRHLIPTEKPGKEDEL